MAVEVVPSPTTHREERRIITALFADLAGSTQLGERLDPEDFRDLTGGALAIMGAAIEGVGGTVRGTAGDGVLGLFGAPTAHEDDAERAVIAGLRLVREMRAYAIEAAQRWDVPELHVRVGIETGLAVLGEVRAGSQVQYDASGDCLNTAARLEGSASMDGVLVGPLTHRLVSDAFEWGHPHPLALKGKAEPVLARHALSPRLDPQPSRRGAESGSRLVGRDDELTIADQIVTDVSAKRAQTVFVTGHAGIGKTRIMREFRSRFESVGHDGPAPAWLEGTCLSYGLDEPYLPFRQILRQALGRGVESTAEVRAAVAELVEPARADEVAEVLGMILGLVPAGEAQSRIAALSAESLQRAVIDVVVELVVGLAGRGRVAIAIDDLHWADAASLRLAEGLISELSDDVPVLLILAMRPEHDRAAWRLRENTLDGHPGRANELPLSALDRDAERRLISDLVGEGTLPEELESILLGRATGNPFYLRELLRSLQDTGAIMEEEGRWSFDHEVAVEVPETVERVVLARIDLLPPWDRDLLNAAAVIGREFDLLLLGRIAGADLSPESLSKLTRLGLFEAEGSEYRFSHPLIQETAYLSMLRRGRADLHARAASAIEELSEEGSDGHHAVLARHHAAAGQMAEAVTHYRLAAIASQRVVALDEALNQLDLAIDAAGTLEPEATRAQLPELHLLRGRVKGVNGDYAGGTDDFTNALAGSRLIGDREIEMRALTDLGWLTRTHSYEQALGHHEASFRIAAELGDPATQVTALGRMSMINLNRLRLDDGLALAHRALDIARATGVDSLLGAALDCLKFAALQLGHLELLERTVAEIIDVHERTGDDFLLQWGYMEAATVPLARGDLDQARERIGKAAEINSRFVSDRIARAMIIEARSWIDRAGGDPHAAVATMHAALDTIGAQTTPEFSSWLEASLGSHLIADGKASEAIPVLESALEHSEETESPNRTFRAASHLAWSRWLVGDAHGSRVALTRGQRVLATITAPEGSVFLDGYHSYLAMARTCLVLGDTRGAEGLLVPLVNAARRYGWRDAEREASEVLVEVEAGAAAQVTGSGVPGPADRGP